MSIINGRNVSPTASKTELEFWKNVESSSTEYGCYDDKDDDDDDADCFCD